MTVMKAQDFKSQLFCDTMDAARACNPSFVSIQISLVNLIRLRAN